MFYVGDFGLTIRLQVTDPVTKEAVDISAATATEFEIEDPGRNVSTVTAAFATDGTDGLLDYVIASGLFDERGVWKIRTKVTEGASALYRSEKFEFAVLP